jgi:DNA-binding HxlR family transcriptional regulator
VVGERWSLLIIRELIRGPQRFKDLERSLGIAKNVLTNRLNKLLASGIAVRLPAPENQSWSQYGLTAKGADLFPVIAALMAWGDSYEAPNGAPAVIQHSCGHPAGHRLVCAHCDEVVMLGNVSITAGPGYKPPPA